MIQLVIYNVLVVIRKVKKKKKEKEKEKKDIKTIHRTAAFSKRYLLVG